MSSTDNTTFIQEFQAITGADEAKAKLFGSNSNWSLEVAISNFFDNPNMHDIPPEIDPFEVNNPIPVFSHANEVQVAPVEDPLDSKCGLYDKNKNRIPLRGTKCKATIKDFVADVEIQQRFVNTQDNPIEAIFQFQQDESSIYSFEAEIDGKHIIGQCKEKQSAFAKYDDSIASGHGAYLLEQTDDDTFQLNIGNLPPHKDCILTIKYVTEMYAEGEAIKFYLPMTKYAIYKDNKEEEEEEKVEKVADGVSIEVDVEVSSNIMGIESPSHVIEAKINGKTASVAYKDNSQRETREFSLLIGVEDPHKVTATVEKHDTENSVMLTFFPKIEAGEEDILTEIVFLVDRSGSMAGSRLNQAKNALQLFLRSLPEGTLFNIIGFGTTYEKLFPSSVVFNSDSLRAATKHVQGMSANLAGTDIYSPLKEVFSYLPHAEYPRIVFCVTDGEVNNTSQVIQLVKNSAGSTRVFTLGIGADASRYLVRGLAKAGHGNSEFVVSGERVEAKVLLQLKRALQPVYKHVRLDWGHLNVKSSSPKNIPPLFDGEKIVLYALIDTLPQEQEKNTITMKASTGTRDHTFIVDLDLTKVVDGSLINRLASKNIIRDLLHENDQEKNKSEIIRIATKYGLVTKYTSIVAIEKRSEAVEGNIEKLEVNDIMTDIISEPIPQNLPSDDLFIHPLPAQPIARTSSTSSLLDLSNIGSTISNTGYNLVQSISHKLDFLSSKSDNLEAYHAAPPPPAPVESAPSEPSVSGRRRSISAARQSFGNLTSEIGSAFGDLKTSATSLFKDMMPSSPRKEQQQQQQEIHFDEEAEVSFTDHMDMVIDDPFVIEEEKKESKSKKKSSAPTLAFADNLFGLFKPASSPMTSHAHVNTSVNLSDPSQRPLDRVILLQQANGSWVLEPQLVGLMGLSMTEVMDALNKAFADVDTTKKELLTNVWATVLAVAFIEAKFAAQKEEWQMLTEKAAKWIKKQMSELNTQENKFFEAVKDLIK